MCNSIFMAVIVAFGEPSPVYNPLPKASTTQANMQGVRVKLQNQSTYMHSCDRDVWRSERLLNVGKSILIKLYHFSCFCAVIY